MNILKRVWRAVRNREPSVMDAAAMEQMGGARDALLNRRLVRAGYDAAQTTDANAAHWSHVDSLSAIEANSLGVRKTLRQRSRYERANNCYAGGIVRGFSYSVIGRGPRVDVDLGNEVWNAFVEAELATWMRAIKLARKLRVGLEAQVGDGEDFTVTKTNPKLRTPVKLDIMLIDCDRFTDPTEAFGKKAAGTAKSVDGKHIDEYGNPVSYRCLDSHPSEVSITTPFGTYKDIPAENVFHLFTHRRPGQERGIPDITPALPIFAQMRRWGLATLDAAEAAADLALVMYTEAAPDDSPLVTPFDTAPAMRGTWMALPAGYRPGQVAAQHPNALFSEFRREMVAEAARSILQPYLVAAGDARHHTYSGGRLDKESWDAVKTVVRQEQEDEKLGRLVQAWWQEAQLISNYLPVQARTVRVLPCTFTWPQSAEVDELKAANAAFMRMRAGRSSIPEEIAARGRNWREVRKEQAEALGVTEDEVSRMWRVAIYEQAIELFPTELGGGTEAAPAPREGARE